MVVVEVGQVEGLDGVLLEVRRPARAGPAPRALRQRCRGRAAAAGGGVEVICLRPHFLVWAGLVVVVEVGEDVDVGAVEVGGAVREPGRREVESVLIATERGAGERVPDLDRGVGFHEVHAPQHLAGLRVDRDVVHGVRALAVAESPRQALGEELELGRARVRRAAGLDRRARVELRRRVGRQVGRRRAEHTEHAAVVGDVDAQLAVAGRDAVDALAPAHLGEVAGPRDRRRLEGVEILQAERVEVRAHVGERDLVRAARARAGEHAVEAGEHARRVRHRVEVANRRRRGARGDGQQQRRQQHDRADPEPSDRTNLVADPENREPDIRLEVPVPASTRDRWWSPAPTGPHGDRKCAGCT
jgi:hypothetical protein